MPSVYINIDVCCERYEQKSCKMTSPNGILENRGSQNVEKVNLRLCLYLANKLMPNPFN